MGLGRRTIVVWLVVLVVVGGGLGVLLYPGQSRTGAMAFGADEDPKSSAPAQPAAAGVKAPTENLQKDSAASDLRRRLMEPVEPLQPAGASMPLAEVLDLLRNKFQVKIDFDQSLLEDLNIDQIGQVEQQSVRLPRLSTPTLDSYLRQLLKQVGATYLQRGDRLVVVWEYFVTSGQHANVPVLLDLRKPISLNDALNYLADQYGVTIVLDARVAHQFAESPVQGVFQNVGLEKVVLLLAEMSGLRVIVLDGAYFITSEKFATRPPALIRPEEMGAASSVTAAEMPKR